MPRSIIVGLLIVCLWLPSAQAEPIFWNELTVNLDSISFTTTGDLDIDFTGSSPRGSIVSRDVIWYDDISEYRGPYGCLCSSGVLCNYTAGAPFDFTSVSKEWSLSATGSGYLSFNVDFTWFYDALPGYLPDAGWAGPDDIYVWALLNDTVVGFYQLDVNAPQLLISGHTYGRTLFFDGADLRTLTITAQTCANGGWIDKPPPLPVPEPSTALTLLAGCILFGTRRFSKSKTTI